MGLSGELARNLVNAAPDATVIVDTRGVIVCANALVEKVFGYKPAELFDRPIEILFPDRFQAGQVRQRNACFENPTYRSMGSGLELYGLRKDGCEFPAEISLSPLQTRSGLLVSHAIRDITDRKAVELALTRAHNEAERANRVKSAFLAAASHDLRQPVQTLSLLNAALARIAAPRSREADKVPASRSRCHAEPVRTSAPVWRALHKSGPVRVVTGSFSLSTTTTGLRAQRLYCWRSRVIGRSLLPTSTVRGTGFPKSEGRRT